MTSSSKLLSAMVRAAAHAALEQYRRAAGPAVHPPPSERTLRAAHEQGRRPENELTVKGVPSKGDPSTGRASLLLGHSDVTVCYVRFSSATRTAIAVLFTVWPAMADLAGG